MGKLKTSKNSPVISGTPMSDKQFKIFIKAAEKGPFYSMQQVSERIENWKTKHSKQ